MFIAMICLTTVVNAQNTGSSSLSLSMTVDQYIETGPLESWNLGLTSHATGGGVGSREQLYSTTKEWNLAYANCGFTVSISGNNPGNQQVPRFARLETGVGASGFDELPTLYNIGITTNNIRTNFFNTLIGANQLHVGGYSKQYPDTPHNGQVKMDMYVRVNSSAAHHEGSQWALTEINPNFTHQQSADAGLYECTMVVTLAAI